ncbi:MAG: O-antigen ligase family protein [Clostridia bacterium]|nr:O-antigen ligase family protein [Clostridia bacterium]
MENFKVKYLSFINSFYYSIICALIVFISHTFGLELLAIISIGLSVSLGLLFSSSLNFVLVPALTIFFTLSEKNSFNGQGKFYSFGSLFTVSVVVAIFIGCLIYHLINNRKDYYYKHAFKSPLFYGILILSISFLLNNFIYKERFFWKDLGFSIALVIAYLGVFLLLYVGLKFDEKLKSNIVFALFIASMVVTLEFYSLFVTGQIKFTDGEIVKESIVTGWGIWNTIGCYLSMLLPIHFYLASFVKRYGFIFYGTGLISYLAIVLSLSRSSLLAGTFVLGISVIVSCFFGENKKVNRIITSVLFVCAIGGIILMWDKIANVLGDYLERGLDDNGRFEIYATGWKKFLSHPVFGCGFYNSHHINEVGLPFGYHNTIVQMMASCGVIGLLAYLYHRYQTVALFIKQRCVKNFYLMLCICALLITSLLDIHMFSLYPTLYYILILITIEKTK